MPYIVGTQYPSSQKSQHPSRPSFISIFLLKGLLHRSVLSLCTLLCSIRCLFVAAVLASAIILLFDSRYLSSCSSVIFSRSSDMWRRASLLAGSTVTGLACFRLCATLTLWRFRSTYSYCSLRVSLRSCILSRC